jgi:hypothetical protein
MSKVRGLYEDDVIILHKYVMFILLDSLSLSYCHAYMHSCSFPSLLAFNKACVYALEYRLQGNGDSF